MKLRNKDDGRIREFGIDETKSFPYYLRDELGNTYWAKTIKEIADKWEEIEELKRTWYIDTWGSIRELEAMEMPIGWEEKPIFEFETKEDAEKAVEKLKAWKRLKDLGFKCSYYSSGYHRGTFTADFVFDEDKLPIMDTFVAKDLNLLFGGEE